MGFWDWLKGLFGGPPARDLSRLGEDQDLDAVQEVVRSGGPLKEHHRRLALRDPRLLPKRKKRFGKPDKVMSRSEAGRLFAKTMRTRDRGIRDLLADEEQLGRLGLPIWRDEAELAAALGLTVGALRHYAMHRERERVRHYVTFAIPKASGGERLIQAPKRRLKAIQRTLHRELVSRLPVSEHAHGFRAGRSVKTGAEPHVGRAVLLRLDLKDFFPSVHVGRVRGLLVAYGYSYPVATTLAVLMTECERQPVDVDGELFHVPVGPRHCVQGAPTSPGICNAIALRLDRRLAGLARSFGASYTRYADDLTFSWAEEDEEKRGVQALRSLAGRIAREEGFALNRAKTRVLRRGRRQRVTGVTVNEVLGLSRTERRRMRAAVHRMEQALAEGRADPGELRRLRGRVAWLRMLNPAQADALRADALFP